jgi:hypothetical protein
MENNLQTWIYVKSAWKDWLKDLPDAEVGEIFKALYTGVVPESATAKGIYLAIKEEFTKVNDSAKRKIIQKNERLNN